MAGLILIACPPCPKPHRHPKSTVLDYIYRMYSMYTDTVRHKSRHIACTVAIVQVILLGGAFTYKHSTILATGMRTRTVHGTDSPASLRIPFCLLTQYLSFIQRSGFRGEGLTGANAEMTGLCVNAAKAT